MQILFYSAENQLKQRGVRVGLAVGLGLVVGVKVGLELGLG